MPVNSGALGVRANARLILEDERSVQILRGSGADMLDATLPVCAKVVVAQTIRFPINDLLETSL